MRKRERTQDLCYLLALSQKKTMEYSLSCPFFSLCYWRVVGWGDNQCRLWWHNQSSYKPVINTFFPCTVRQNCHVWLVKLSQNREIESVFYDCVGDCLDNCTLTVDLYMNPKVFFADIVITEPIHTWGRQMEVTQEQKGFSSCRS